MFGSRLAHAASSSLPPFLLPAERRSLLVLLLLIVVALLTEWSVRSVTDTPYESVTNVATTLSVCAHVPDRPPRFLTADELASLPRLASLAPLTFRVCESSSVHCSSVVNLTTPFTAERPAPPAQGLTPSDSARLRRQFWWQTRPELAPRPFGWVLPEDGGAGGVGGGTTDRAELARLRSLAGLYHSYGVGVGRAGGPGGGFVELCKRCSHEGALLVLPRGGAAAGVAAGAAAGAAAAAGGTPGVNALVQWAARVIAEPPRRRARRADAGYYARAAASPVESRVGIVARLRTWRFPFSAATGQRQPVALPPPHLSRLMCVRLTHCSRPGGEPRQAACARLC